MTFSSQSSSDTGSLHTPASHLCEDKVEESSCCSPRRCFWLALFPSALQYAVAAAQECRLLFKARQRVSPSMKEPSYIQQKTALQVKCSCQVKSPMPLSHSRAGRLLAGAHTRSAQRRKLPFKQNECWWHIMLIAKSMLCLIASH